MKTSKKVALVLVCVLLTTAFQCSGGNTQRARDIRRDIAVQIHRIENTLLRLTEAKQLLVKEGRLSSEDSIVVSRAILRINESVLAANKLLAQTTTITPTNRTEIMNLIQNSLTFVGELNRANFGVVSAQVQDFLNLVNILNTSFMTIRSIMEGVNR